MYNIKCRMNYSVNVGNELVFDFIAILFPIHSVFTSTSFIISANSMDQYASKNEHILIGNDMISSTSHTHRECK